MGTVRQAALALCVILAACTEEPPGWTRVVEIGEADYDYYSIVHADRDADVCVRLALQAPYTASDPGDDAIDVRGADYVLAGAWGSAYTPNCTNDYMIKGPNEVSGTVEFDNFVNTMHADVPCSVSFELSIEGDEGQIYEMSARDFPILDVGCPRPGLYSGEYTYLDAAYGEHNGYGNLVVATWDAQRDVCVWARLLSEDAGVSEDGVAAPGGWVYSGLRFGLTERDACVASNFIVPPTNTTYATDSAPASGSSGTVSFAATGPGGLPCALDVDLSLRSQGRFDWTPDDVFMHAAGVPVSGACD